MHADLFTPSVRGKPISVVVRDETFIAHESVLSSSSLYLRAAVSERWQKSIEGNVELSDVEPDVFAIYLHWCYFDTISVRSIGDDSDTEDIDLGKAYILGDRLIDISFQNAVIDAVVEKYEENDTWCPPGTVIEYVYAYTTESAKIRDLLIDLYFNRCEISKLRDDRHKEHLPQPFLLELAARLKDRLLSGSSDYSRRKREIKTSYYYAEPMPVRKREGGGYK